MKSFLAIALLLCSAASHAGYTQTLETPSFTVKIKVLCEEGAVSCGQVRYVGTQKKTGKSITLRGETEHTLCADGVTPCRFLGYVFRKGGVTYFVSDDGQLIVTQGKKTLVDEKGEWQ